MWLALCLLDACLLLAVCLSCVVLFLPVCLRVAYLSLAFRFRDTDGTLVEDFKSSRDHGVGPQILKHIRDAKLENVVCFLSHSYEDRFIDGKTKFSLIERCVKDSLRDHQNLMVADRGGENMSAQGEDESDQSSY